MYLDEVEKYLHKALQFYKTIKPGLMEDAIQEGMIQAWRDIDAGVSPKLKVMRRAAMCARRYLHRDGENNFGAPARSHEGFQSAHFQQVLDKVQTYLDEFVPVYDRMPNGVEVSNALGIKAHTARNALNRIKEGRLDHMKYGEVDAHGRRRKDRNAYHVNSVETFIPPDANANSSWADNPVFAEFQTAFESDLLSDMWFDDVLSKLGAETAKIIELRFKYGYSCLEIGKYRGYTTNIAAKGSRIVANAVSQVQIILAPYQGACTAGHERTPESAVIKKRSDGVYIRMCIICRKTNGGFKAPTGPSKIGRPPVVDCPKGHGPKDYRDSRGTLRCHTCKNDAQRRSAAKQREKRDRNASS